MSKNKPEENKKQPRRFSRKGEGLTSFVEGETIRGKFLLMKTVEIKDRQTGRFKTIRVYTLQLPDGNMARIGSRALLDDVFDEVAAVYGGVEKLHNKDMAFIRGEDVPNEDDPEMKLGTYDIEVYD